MDGEVKVMLASLFNPARLFSGQDDNLQARAVSRANRLPAASLTLDGVTVSYRGQAAIRNASLRAAPRQILALVGPSGCGKSSLLASINRMTDSIDGCRVSGEIRIDDAPIMAPAQDPVALRKKVGMVFQTPNAFPLSVRDNICFVLEDHGVRSAAERERRMEAVLRQTHLWEEVRDRLDDSALRLSGGQQQRLCIARALVLEPQLLLLDEPCSALDPLSTEAIEQLLQQLKETITIVMVTHNLAQARRIADQVAVCWTDSRGGYLVECGSAEQIFTDPSDPVTAAYCLGRAG